MLLLIVLAAIVAEITLRAFHHIYLIWLGETLRADFRIFVFQRLMQAPWPAVVGGRRANIVRGQDPRVTPDGDPAPDNPDPDSPLWTWGHRNVQGLAFDDDGNLWASEFGDNTYDELNLIERGRNYGWPEVEGRGSTEDGEFTNPQVVWETFEASPSGLAHLDGRLWLAALRGTRLWRIDIEDGRATNPTDFFVGDYGRLRTVVVAPDGNLWVTTSNRDGRAEPGPDDDQILVVSPG